MDKFTKILFRKFNVEAVAVVEAVANKHAVLKFAPVELAFKRTVLYETFMLVVAMAAVKLIPLTDGDKGLLVEALGAVRSPIRLLKISATPEEPRLVTKMPETVGAPVEVLEIL
jgi:hypothetical protein